MTLLQEGDWIWKDGRFVAWEEAELHVLSSAVQFGSSVFEGIRCYDGAETVAIFRLDEHLRRLRDSCRVYGIDLPYSVDELAETCIATVRRNGLRECYLRPMVLRGYGSAGLDPSDSPIEVYVPCWQWGEYLGEGALEDGVDVCVATWQRPHPNTFPVSAKAAGHYNNAQLIKTEARRRGYTEAIALNTDGTVSEGSGQNVFLVRDGTLVTPSRDGSALYGITRDSVLKLADDLSIPVRERRVAREELYTCDELFFVGTATEVTPVRSVDDRPVDGGSMGPITRSIQRAFEDTVRGRNHDHREWLTPVPTNAGG